MARGGICTGICMQQRPKHSLALHPIIFLFFLLYLVVVVVCVVVTIIIIIIIIIFILILNRLDEN